MHDLFDDIDSPAQQRIDRLAEMAQELRRERDAVLAELATQREHQDELAHCLSDAVDRMLGSSPTITALRKRSLAAITRTKRSAETSGANNE